eukprot:COSAG02_NODE_1114_length_14502_cov_140.830035_15_plen_169_part_00
MRIPDQLAQLPRPVWPAAEYQRGRAHLFLQLCQLPCKITLPTLVYTCAVDAEQCIRALKRVGCVGATVCETRLNAEAIAQATYSDTLDALHTIPVLTIGTASLNQCDRSVFPFYITQDPGSGAVTFMSSMPGVKVKSTSTLFTKMLSSMRLGASWMSEKKKIIERKMS